MALIEFISVIGVVGVYKPFLALLLLSLAQFYDAALFWLVQLSIQCDSEGKFKSSKNSSI